MANLVPHLPWLQPNAALPDPSMAWPKDTEAPGLLAAGADLSVNTLHHAYKKGIFPWFSSGQPILWWSPDPRMVLHTGQFKVSRSLRKTLQKFKQSPDCEIRIDTAFEQVIRSCAQQTRRGQSSTWIVPDMVQAYLQMHDAGWAHSVETWINGQLAGGLYAVALGRAVFGESMFTRTTDASKIALAALVAFSKHHGVQTIDCQQNTAHLASLGASELPRSEFLAHIALAQHQKISCWQFDPLYWNTIL